MKKIFFIALMCMLSVMAQAEQKSVTKFLGIPVAGTKTTMIQKLKAKGFVYNKKFDCLKGEFNGTKVNLFVVTKNNKVWRIMVQDAYTVSETDIKIRFNNLCNSFEDNGKYHSFSFINCLLEALISGEGFKAENVVNNKIPEDEDISYNMRVKNKRYEAGYCQLLPNEFDSIGSQDSVKIRADFENYLKSKYKESEMAELSKLGFGDVYKDYVRTIIEKKFNEIMKRSVWFMISEDEYESPYRPYRILMYYDNWYNNKEGEDL